MEERIKELLAYAKRLGATNAENRTTGQKNQPILMRNGQVESVSTGYDAGVGCRVLVNGGWGFASTPSTKKEDQLKMVERAVQIAKASARSKLRDVELAPVEIVTDKKETRVLKDPFQMPVDRLAELLKECHEAMVQVPEVKVTGGSLFMSREEKTFASSEGVWIEQTISITGGGVDCMARGNNDVQRRSFNMNKTAGFEALEAMNLVQRSTDMAQEAKILLTADSCPRGVDSLILDSSIARLQVHESCGHPIELDRVLGSEDTYAGKSFLTPDLYGKDFRFGSPHVTITADATLPGGLGSFFYDDEGVPAQRTTMVDAGIFKNYLTSRETAKEYGGHSNGSMRAMNWANIPLIRMTNINLEPGDWTLDEIIRDTKSGILACTPKSWSLDDKRMNFHFSPELAYEIKDGEITRPLKNAAYTALTPEFWGSCDAVAGKAKGEWDIWGSISCAKGEPIQSIGPGHGVAPARFRNIKIGVGE